MFYIVLNRPPLCLSLCLSLSLSLFISLSLSLSLSFFLPLSLSPLTLSLSLSLFLSFSLSSLSLSVSLSLTQYFYQNLFLYSDHGSLSRWRISGGHSRSVPPPLETHLRYLTYTTQYSILNRVLRLQFPRVYKHPGYSLGVASLAWNGCFCYPLLNPTKGICMYMYTT